MTTNSPVASPAATSQAPTFARGLGLVRLRDGSRRRNDRLRNLHRLRRHVAPNRQCRMAPRCVAFRRRAHDRRSAFLRRARRHDAARRRNVHLLARSILPALGFSLRLDALHRNPDRHHRRRRHRLRAFFRRAVSVGVGGSLLDCADSRFEGLRVLALDRATRRHRRHRRAYLDQQPRPAIRQNRPKCFHRRQDRSRSSF